jgi:ribose/xylose/arabinose/galactoside ABC-type transport system permease subunit
MAIISIININNCENRRRKFWFETGLQVSNLISTLALTYTLLGISLGIGELSSSKLDIDTINQTISKLTQQFSMAFMTSVIGLPLSGLLRSILIIIYEHFTVQSLKTSPKLLSK